MTSFASAKVDLVRFEEEEEERRKRRRRDGLRVFDRSMKWVNVATISIRSFTPKKGKTQFLSSEVADF